MSGQNSHKHEISPITPIRTKQGWTKLTYERTFVFLSRMGEQSKTGLLWRAVFPCSSQRAYIAEKHEPTFSVWSESRFCDPQEKKRINFHHETQLLRRHSVSQDSPVIPLERLGQKGAIQRSLWANLLSVCRTSVLSRFFGVLHVALDLLDFTDGAHASSI